MFYFFKEDNIEVEGEGGENKLVVYELGLIYKMFCLVYLVLVYGVLNNILIFCYYLKSRFFI